MASLDQLNIEITSSTNSAEKAIRGLEKALKDLNKQLGLSDGTKFSRTLNSMALAMDKFSGKMSGINADNFEKVSRGAQRTSESLKKSTDNAEKFREALSKISAEQIAFKQKQLFEKDLGKSSNPNDFKQVRKQEPQLALPMFDKMLPAVIKANDALSNMDITFADIIDKSSGLDAITQAFLDWKSQLADLSGASFEKWLVPEQGVNPSFYRESLGWISDIKSSGGEDYFYKIEDAANKCLPAIRNVGETALSTSSSIKNIIDSTGEFVSISESMEGTVEKSADAIEKSTKKVTSGGGKESLGTLASLMALGHELEEIAGKFEKLANIGKGALKLMVKPLQLAAEEYVEKFEGIKKSFDNFKGHIQKGLTKMSAFWKRIMKTFTFMLVRKAITAIIKEINNAIQSMAKFSDAMGTQFNNSISTLVADFQYLGRSIVSVFAPLINFIAPIIDAIVDKIALLLSYIGMLMAALTGASSFTKAKKNVGNYAQSLDKASKSAKNLTMGIDELNILAENTGGGAGGAADGWEDAWEEVEIPDWINDLAKKIKDIFKDLFEPIKKAWDKAKAYVLAGWNYMCREMSLLLKAIWDDFIEVWKSDTMVDVFYKLFLILGDIEYTIGNLARKFRLAWEEGEKGLKIFQNLAEILDILVNHVRNVTLYMTAWSDQLDFNPLLESIVNLTEALKGLADFLGGVFEDVMENVVLKYIKFLIEEGIPHLNNTIAEIMNAFDFEKIRNDLKPLEEAFERLLENLDIGKTNAIGNLGKQFAEFTNSQEFTDFMQRLADIMDLISAEDVEKILTGIGEGILRVAEGLVKFVNSDLFMDFLTKIDEWLANASAEDIADLFEKLAIAIGLFEFSAFAMDKIAGFIQFMSIISAAKNLGEIAAGMNGVAAGSEAVGASAVGLGAFAAIIAVVVLAVASMVESFGGLKGLLAEIGRRFQEVKKHLSGLADKFNISEKIDSLKESFNGLKEALGGFKDFWMIVFDTIQLKVEAVLGGTMGFISGLIVALEGAIQYISGVLEVLSGVVDVIIGVFTLDPDKILEGFEKIGQGIEDVFNGVLTFIDGIFTEILGTIDGFLSAFGIDSKLTEMYENLKTWAIEKKNAIIEFFQNFDLSAAIDSIVQWFRDLPEKIAYEIGFVLGKLAQWVVDIVAWATESIPQLIDDIVEWWKELPEKLYTKLLYAIDSFNKWKSKASEWILTNVPLIIDDFISWFKEIPQKLRDLGKDIIDGLFGGIKDAWDGVKSGANAIKTICDEFVQGFKDGFGIASPSKEAATVGEYFIEGLILPLQEDTSWMESTIFAFCNLFVGKFQEILLPEHFAFIGQNVILGIQMGFEHSNADTIVLSFAQRFILLFQTVLNPQQFAQIGTIIVQSIADSMAQALPLLQGVIQKIGTALMNAITEFGNTLGTMISGTMFPAFIETYIMPYFTMEMWQPLLNQLLEQVLIPAFEEFTVWFDETMKVWWDENLLYWFSPDKWNEDIFRPLKECIQEHWEMFSSWWDSTMLAWWNNQVIPWFEKNKWKDQFNNILEVAKEVFKLVKQAIKEQMDEAKEAVEEACQAMKESLQSVLEVIGTIMSQLSSLGSVGSAIQIKVGGFASGGYPTQGSLFLAGESGAELIGTIGGKTAVASNDEITGIRDAVYATGNEESQLLAQLINIGRAMLDKDPVIIGDKDIARMANNGQGQLGMSIIR